MGDISRHFQASAEAQAPRNFYKGITPVQPGNWYSGMLSRNQAINMGADNWNGMDLAAIRAANTQAREDETKRRADEAAEQKIISEAQAKRDSEIAAYNAAQEAERQRQLLLVLMMSKMWG